MLHKTSKDRHTHECFEEFTALSLIKIDNDEGEFIEIGDEVLMVWMPNKQYYMSKNTANIIWKTGCVEGRDFEIV